MKRDTPFYGKEGKVQRFDLLAESESISYGELRARHTGLFSLCAFWGNDGDLNGIADGKSGVNRNRNGIGIRPLRYRGG